MVIRFIILDCHLELENASSLQSVRSPKRPPSPTQSHECCISKTLAQKAPYNIFIAMHR